MRGWIMYTQEDRISLLIEQGISENEARYFAQETWFCLPVYVRKLVRACFISDSGDERMELSNGGAR